MVNAYSTPERTAAHMQKLDENHELIMKLRDQMSDVNADMADCVLAFTQLFDLHDGDQHQQRRLVVNLEHVAKRHKQKH